MVSKRVQEVVDRFVVELIAVAKVDAAEEISNRLRGVFGGEAPAREVSPAKDRKTTKGYKVTRPCPIEGCGEIAVSRFGMVCKGHSETLSREEVLVARDNAKKPGGVWAAADDPVPVKTRRTTKGYTVLRPCPIAGCQENAAPRFGMVCKAHGAALSREEILVARDNAVKPGGIWFGLKASKKVA
jgi:hypothetical protein